MEGQVWRPEEPPKPRQDPPPPVLEPVVLEELSSLLLPPGENPAPHPGPVSPKGAVHKAVPPAPVQVPALPLEGEASERPVPPVPEALAIEPPLAPEALAVEPPAPAPKGVAVEPPPVPEALAVEPTAPAPKGVAVEPPPVPEALAPEPDVPKEPPVPEGRALKGPVPLSNEAVTGHTASLWKYLPVPEDQPEPAPEYKQLHRKFPGGQVTAARVRGKKHKHEGTNCDDWFEAAGYRDLVFAAVSDGAGSKKLSRIGARESCRAAVGYMRRAFEELLTRKPELLADVARDFAEPRCMDACRELAGVVQESLRRAREAVEAACWTRAADPAWEAFLGRTPEPRDFSATLLAAAVIPAGNEGHLVVSCQVGDGMIALIDGQADFAGALKLMGDPDSGDYSGETDFLTSPKMAALETLQSRTKLSRGRSGLLLMMTDGVADDYFPCQPELLRLYCDLLANGVLAERLQTGELTAERMRRYGSLPPPLAYPWVNDQSVQVPLHYARRILQETGMGLEELWRDRTALAMLGLASEGLGADPAERLLRWLDNYVERGSFDDRTLLAVTM